MPDNRSRHKAAIREVAAALGPLNKEVIFVGGAVLSLYINDPAAEDVRITKDIDISLSVVSYAKLEKFREELVQKGFKQSTDLKVMCRFKYKNILVDVMNTKEIVWAPANRWFSSGFAERETVDIEGLDIHILPLAYYLASKFEAFNDRGIVEPRLSHDFEDIVYLFDNRTDIEEQLIKAPGDVKPFLIKQIKEIMIDGTMKEAIYGNLVYSMRDERYDRIIKICTTVLDKDK